MHRVGVPYALSVEALMSQDEPKVIGRPKKYHVDVDVVEKMAGYGCSPKEIADVLGVPYKSIIRDGKEALVKGKGNMKCRLRKAQYDNAIKGNAVMQIWLGKQILNQTDNGTFEEDELVDDVTFDLDEQTED